MKRSVSISERFMLLCQGGDNSNSSLDKKQTTEWKEDLKKTFLDLQTFTTVRLGLVFETDTVNEILTRYQMEFDRLCRYGSSGDGQRYQKAIVEHIERLKERFQISESGPCDDGGGKDDNDGKQEQQQQQQQQSNTNINQHGDYHQNLQDNDEDILLRLPSMFNEIGNRFGGHSNDSCHHIWQLWYWKSDHFYTKWDYGLQKLAKPITDVKRLSMLLENLIDVADVVIPSDYSLFRDSISPKWEDSANRNGGCWVMELKRSTTDSKLIQNIWKRLLCFIVEYHCDGQHKALKRVCGIKISVRFKLYVLSVWTESFSDLEINYEIGLVIQRIIFDVIREHRSSMNQLSDPEKPSLLYRAHCVAQQNAAIKERTKPVIRNGVGGVGGCNPFTFGEVENSS